MSEEHYIARLFEPRSIALIGASESLDKVGGRVLDNLLAGGFNGTLYAVNPRHAEIRGVPCHPSIGAIATPVDLAVIALPAASVPGIIEDCGRAGVRNAIVLSAGFAEVGPAGAKLERAMLAAAKPHRVRILGPNCVGVMRPRVGMDATFARGGALAGSIALVSQSGAVCTAMLDWAKPNGIGFSSVVSLGASSDIDFGEVIDYLAFDAHTEKILLYIEGVRDGRRLVSSLRAAARAKPVILMKVGRHPAGSRAAISHTGALVGDDDVFEAVVRRTGVVRVRTMTELVAVAEVLAAHVRPAGEKLAVITNGGGPGVMAADRAGDLGIPLAQFSAATVEKLARALPANWSRGNPVDLIGDAGPARYAAAVRACLDDPGVDGVVAILTPQAMTKADDAAAAVVEAARGSAKPVLACWMGEASVGEAMRRFREAGMASFSAPETAVEAFAHIAAHYRNQRTLLEVPGPLAHVEPPDLEAARALVHGALARGESVLNARDSKALLHAFRIPVAASAIARSENEALRVAAAAGYPVAVKIESRDITHKSDVDGVRLGVASAEGVSQAWHGLRAALERRRPGARFEGVAIEPMVRRPRARELMAGIVTDSIFGPVVAFGAGGIAIEVLRDRSVALPPLNDRLVDELVARTRISRMLGDFRHLPAIDRGALRAALLRISEIACLLPEVAELDVNPLLADEDGVIALDARVRVVRASPHTRPYGHLAIHPYPAELVQSLDALGVVLRPIRPEDAGIESDFVAGLSPQASRQRFRMGLRGLTPAMLARFTQVDYDREMALIAVRSEGGRETQVGVCRYVTLPDGETCEFAIVVADAWQGRGLGRRMMLALAEVARRRGLRTLLGWVAADNFAMLRFCAALGFTVEPDPGDAGTSRVALSLAGRFAAAG